MKLKPTLTRSSAVGRTARLGGINSVQRQRRHGTAGDACGSERPRIARASRVKACQVQVDRRPSGKIHEICPSSKSVLLSMSSFACPQNQPSFVHHMLSVMSGLEPLDNVATSCMELWPADCTMTVLPYKSTQQPMKQFGVGSHVVGLSLDASSSSSHASNPSSPASERRNPARKSFRETVTTFLPLPPKVANGLVEPPASIVVKEAVAAIGVAKTFDC